MRASSPLTRGKLFRGLLRLWRHGFIPAHAGKTMRVARLPGDCSQVGWLPPSYVGLSLFTREYTTPMSSFRPKLTHPHSRGENWPGLKPAQRSPGSPPLTRGKHQPPGISTRNDGLIPAHAGKTYSPAEPPRRERAHPHSRRENTLGGNGALNNAGSSPLTRGNRKPEQAVKYSWGSSPLTRGKRGRPRCKHPRTGLIPAHAGKTARRRRTLRSRRAHPRSRRENTSWRVPAMPLKGPSPLTRGKLVEQPSLLSVLRLIPAHAGKTAYPASS